MLLAYAGTAVGAGLMILLLLAVSGVLLAVLVGRLTFVLTFGFPKLVEHVRAGTVLHLVSCVIPVLLALAINADLFADPRRRNFALMFIAAGIPIGVLGGLLVRASGVRRDDEMR